MDPVVKQIFKNMIKTWIMLDPKMITTLPAVWMKNPAMAKQMILNTVRNEGLNTIFKKYGPIASIMFHEGGPLGLGTTGPMGMGIQQSMMRDPLGTVGKLRFAMAFPGITGIGWLVDKFFPTGGERGPLGATFGPRLADAASKIFPGVQSTQDWLRGGGGTGIMGGTLGPRIKNFFGNIFGGGSGGGGGGIQEIDISTLPTKRGSGYSSGGSGYSGPLAPQAGNFWLDSGNPVTPATGWDPSMGAAPSINLPPRRK